MAEGETVVHILLARSLAGCSWPLCAVVGHLILVPGAAGQPPGAAGQPPSRATPPRLPRPLGVGFNPLPGHPSIHRRPSLSARRRARDRLITERPSSRTRLAQAQRMDQTATGTGSEFAVGGATDINQTPLTEQTAPPAHGWFTRRVMDILFEPDEREVALQCLGLALTSVWVV